MGKEALYFISGLMAGYTLGLIAFYFVFNRVRKTVFQTKARSTKPYTTGHTERQRKVLVHDDAAAYNKELEDLNNG